MKGTSFFERGYLKTKPPCLSSSFACPSVCHTKRLFIASTTVLCCQTSWSEPCSERAHSPQNTAVREHTALKNTACFWLSEDSLCLTTISDKSPCLWCGYSTLATRYTCLGSTGLHRFNHREHSALGKIHPFIISHFPWPTLLNQPCNIKFVYF